MNLDERPTSRRGFLALGAGFFAVAVIPLARSRARRLVRRRLPIMGTIAEFAVVGDDVHPAIDAAVAELEFVDSKMSRFRATSDVGRLNRAGAGVAVSVSGATADVLDHALRWAERSAGRFDPCLGAATELWDVTRRHTPPPAEKVDRLAARDLYRALDLDGGCAVVRDPDVLVDLGGIAKGYAVDRAARALRRCGVENALVNVGGDLVALGESEDGDAWRIGVADPADPTRILREIAIRDEAVATSGDYVRCFRHGGRRYHHLLDPKSGEPYRTARRSLTVVAQNCLTADAATTACFGLEPDRTDALLRGRARVV